MKYVLVCLKILDSLSSYRSCVIQIIYTCGLSIGKNKKVAFFLLALKRFIYFVSVHHSYQLADNEEPISIMSCRLGSSSSPYYVVGTAFVYLEEPEPKLGRILIFQYQDSKKCVAFIQFR